MCIPGCQVGRHSNQVPAVEMQRRAEVAAANQAALDKFDQQAAVPDADGKAPPPKQNVAAAAAAPPPKPRPKPKLPEGYARCKHYGCQKDYLIENNVEGSCVVSARACSRLSASNPLRISHCR